MWRGFQAKKLNTCGEHEFDANWAEPENQAWLVPGPDPDQKIQNFKSFFSKIKSASMPVHHVKGQPGVSTYVREKGCLTCDTHRETPCAILHLFILPTNSWL